MVTKQAQNVNQRKKFRSGRNYLAAATAIIVPVLLFFLLVFVFVQFWYFYVETETTLSKIASINQSYDEKLRQITPSSSPIAQREVMQLSFLKEFNGQQVWERSHERVNRRYSTLIGFTEWFVKLFVLFLAVFSERLTSPGSKASAALKRNTVVLVVFFAAISIALPALSHKLGYEARQKLHDFRAQQLGFLIVELESGVTDPRSAWMRFQGLYKESPSSYASRPGF